MNLLRSRDLHALWVGTLVAGLALWFGVFWIVILTLVALGIGALVIRWLAWLFTPPDLRDHF